METAPLHRYLIAVGSNQRHPRFGAPRRVLAAALERLAAEGGSNDSPFVVSLSNHELRDTPTSLANPSFDKLRTNGGGKDEKPKAIMRVIAAAPIIETDPIGPSIRRYANSAAVIETELDPEELLATLKRIEREFGRRASGQRWRARVLDLDIVLWTGGPYASPSLTIPHPLFRERRFVLDPAVAIAPDWRDPLTGATLRQLHARLTRNQALPKRAGGQ